MSKPAITITGNGKGLADLLIKAAGLEGKRVKSLECRVAKDEVVKFTVELFGLEEDIGKALGEEPVTAAPPSWKDCELCGSVRIPIHWQPAWCTGCGGPRVNCIHCGTGRTYWSGAVNRPFVCPNCKRDPLQK